MNIERMKFAWARGARIETKGVVTNGRWHEVDPPYWQYADNGYNFRIHPDDEHLQYGSVSTAFRDMALYTDSAELPEMVEMFMDLAGQNLDGSLSSAIEHDFARLFVAELLADEGL